MKLNTIFFTKSTQGGGVQTLIKSIEKEALKEGIGVNEIYHKTPWSELYDEIDEVKYFKLSSLFENKSFKLNFIWNIYFSRKKLMELVSNNDKIIIFSPNYLLYIPVKILRNNKIILVQTNRADMFFTTTGKLILKKYGKFIDYLTVYTKYDMEKIAKLYFDEKHKIKIIPRACTLKTAPKEKVIGKNLIFIGRIMEEQKNISGLIEIMKLLPSEFKLNIYGNGPEVAVKMLEKMIEGHDNIVFHGPTRNVKEKLIENNIFLMTSRYEGFGNTLIEARSQGLPIIAYDTFEALKWIVEDGKNGYLIPFEDQKKFADSILKISNSEKIYSEMSRNALKMSESTEYEKIMKKWRELINE